VLMAACPLKGLVGRHSVFRHVGRFVASHHGVPQENALDTTCSGKERDDTTYGFKFKPTFHRLRKPSLNG
jgi:hypothetical protein